MEQKTNPRKNNRWLILGIVVSAIAILVIFLIMGLQQQNRVYTSADEIPRISAQEAYRAVTSGQAVLVDTRSADQFAARHAQGAINLPLDQVESQLDQLNKAQWYITYCT